MNNSAASSLDYQENSRFVDWVTRPIPLVFLTVVALILILLFGAFVYFYHPYSGIEISWHANFGRVSAVYSNGPAAQAGVRIGDRLLSIDGQELQQWNNGPAYRWGIRQGDRVVFEFHRGRETFQIPITMGGYFDNWNWYWYSFLIHFLAICFWGLGAAMCIFSPPYDICSRLLGLGFLLAGVTAAVGLVTGFNSFWGANTLGIILRAWVGTIYVAAHLTFPAITLFQYRRQLINIFVAVAAVITALALISTWSSTPGELSLQPWFALDLRRLVLIFFFVSWGLGTGLLFYNRIYSQDSEVKRQTGVVLWGSLLGFGPFFVFVVLPFVLFQEQYTSGLLTLVFLLLVPLSYVYVIHQRKLLRMDFFINRFVVLFSMVLFVFSLASLFLGAFTMVFGLSPGLPFIGGMVAALAVLPSATIQKNMQIRVNRVLYGNHYDFSTVTAGFSSRLAVTLDRTTLVDLLTHDLSTQMGIQRSVLFLVNGKNLVLQPVDEQIISIPLIDEVCQFFLDRRNPVRRQPLWKSLSPETLQHWQSYAWGELFVPMIFEGKLLGVLVLGERISSELYNESDIQIVATVAYQGALAFANVQLVETLRGLAQRLVRADEDQRRKVARDLHDTVLQDLFFIRQKLSPEQENLTGHISNIIQQLRQTIKAQRTTLLDQGLALALESLVVDMQRIAGEFPQISWANAVDHPLSLSDEQATSIYRMVQEAISNALKHAQANHIVVKLEEGPENSLMILIVDDGIGMPKSGDNMRSEHHYGIVGMNERALMIGARLSIQSAPGEGTSVLLEWAR